MAKDDFSLENAEAQMRKGTLEISVLLTIAQGEVYASDIIKKLIAANLLVVEGTLYPLLSRLRRTGLVQYIWKESKNGPPRKYYLLTHKGTTVLESLSASWNTFDASITKLIKQYEKSH